jgi:transglutaminase-like putative cysteine protease
MATCRYRVEHVTRYEHAERASSSHHVAYLTPRLLPLQRVIDHEVTVSPKAVDQIDRVDYFGNLVRHFSILSPYRILEVASHSVVEVSEDDRIDPEGGPPWEEARTDAQPFRAGVSEFSYVSPYVATPPVVAAFARESFPAGRPLVSAVLDLTRRINRSFRFDPAATEITTSVTRVLEMREGVCQDFAHVEIACLRSLGLAARYVSGYLLTTPPPGHPRLQGADASHAWLSVYCPGQGWLDVDPTNDLVPDTRHITLAWGRDYGDVSPLRGVVLGGGSHTLHVGVSVTPDHAD